MKKLSFLLLLGSSLLMPALPPARAQQPGGLDPSFAPAKIDLGVQQIIAQAGGSALVAGRYTTINGTPVGPVVRLKADGTLDPNFANTNLDYIPAGDTQVNSIAIASGSDGKIYVALNTTPSLTATLVRLNANGSTDTSFHTTVDGAPNAMVVQPNGQVVIAGSFSTLNGVSVNGLPRPSRTRRLHGLLVRHQPPARRAGHPVHLRLRTGRASRWQIPRGRDSVLQQ